MENQKKHSIDYLKNNNYKFLLDVYNTNKNKELKNWLLFEKVFSNLGENGIVGNLIYTDENEYQYPIVFKICKYINYLSIHEDMIIKSLNDLSSYCPHFCRSYGIINTKTSKNYRSDNPFNIGNSYGIENNVLLLEDLQNKPKFNSYINNININENIIFSTIKQVLLSICFAQKKKQFTHYDLHPCNIFMERCKSNIVFLYVLDEYNQFYVASRGHFPIIFDFGFSYSKDIENNNMRCTLAHTKSGHTSNLFDWIADPKVFLVSVSNCLLNIRNSKKIKKLRNVVKNIFSPLKINLSNGWNISPNTQSASDVVVSLFRKLTKINSGLFTTRTYECLDIIQSLIILPFENQNYSDIKINYYTFLNEWIKIENEFESKIYLLSILKNIVETANTLRSSYIDSNTRNGAVEYFKDSVYESINSVSKFCLPKNIDFDILLGSILILAKNIEGIFYDITRNITETRDENYNKLKFESVEQIYATIEVLFQDDFEFKDNTQILIFDSVLEKTSKFKLSKNQTIRINELSNLVKGTYIYDLYKSSIQSKL